MTLGILGNKLGMTQIFNKQGELIPVTVIKSGPCYITQIKTIENCGYNSIQLGYSQITKEKKITKPNLGHFNKVNLFPFRYLREYKTHLDTQDFKVGQKISVEIFNVGEKVNVTGVTIGKGHIGNLKRHGFHRGPMTHGSKHHRLQGSMGAGTTPGRVFRGKRMPGRVGVEQRTVLGLEIIDIDTKENLLVVKGCIPGKSGNLVSIRHKK